MLRTSFVRPIALGLGLTSLVFISPAISQDLPPLPAESPTTAEINRLEQESADLSQEARELGGGGGTIREAASNVRNSFYGHKAQADELEQFAKDMGYTEAELRAEQRRIAESGAIGWGDIGKAGGSQVVDQVAEAAIERFVSAALSKVFGAVSLAKDCYEGTRAIKMWLMTRQQARSLGDSANSIRQNWRLLNELLVTKYIEMGREAAKMRRLEEIQQRYREVRNRIATLQENAAEAAKPATRHATTDREMDSGYDRLLDRIERLKFERKIADLQGNDRKVRELDREIAPLERQAEQAERLPANRQVGMAPVNRTSSALLNYHNALRFAEGSPPLKWNETLAQHAGQWAQVMARTGVLQHAPRSSRPANQRENISLSPRGANSPIKMARVWGNEKRLFRPGIFPNVCSGGEWSSCAHYTQMVWSKTTEVGCAFAQGQRFDALVCRYSPPGNQDNRPVLESTNAVAMREACPPRQAAQFLGGHRAPTGR